MKIYIRRSSKLECACGATGRCYSVIQDKVVRATICDSCYKIYRDNLSGFDLVYLAYGLFPDPVPKFLKRLKDESKTSNA